MFEGITRKGKSFDRLALEISELSIVELWHEVMPRLYPDRDWETF